MGNAESNVQGDSQEYDYIQGDDYSEENTPGISSFGSFKGDYVQEEDEFLLATTLPEFVRKHLDENWFWIWLTENPDIPIEFIEDTLYQEGYDWELYYIGENPNITPEFVQRHSHEIKNWNALSKNSGIPIEFIEETLNQPGYEWIWGEIVKNVNITPEFIEEHLGEIKNWNELSKNSGIPIEFIDETLYQQGYKWKWQYIEQNPNITPEFVKKHRHEIENWDLLTINQGIPIKFVDETLYQEGYKWELYYIGENPNITPKFLQKHRYKIRNWFSLSENPGIPIEFIDETLYQEGYDWEWRHILMNPNITPEFVRKHLHEIYYWKALTFNPGIPIEFIEETLENSGYKWILSYIGNSRYKWEWGEIEKNPNITPEFVRKHLYEIKNWKILSFNPGIPIEFIDETWGQPGYQWNIDSISNREEPYNKQPMIKAARN